MIINELQRRSGRTIQFIKQLRTHVIHWYTIRSAFLKKMVKKYLNVYYSLKLTQSPWSSSLWKRLISLWIAHFGNIIMSLRNRSLFWYVATNAKSISVECLLSTKIIPSELKAGERYKQTKRKNESTDIEHYGQADMIMSMTSQKAF